MAHYKLVMEEDVEDPYALIAIHCSEEAYKVAYLLNKHLNTRFKRRKEDIDISFRGQVIIFPIFDFSDEFNYSQYYLVANKYTMETMVSQGSGGMFTDLNSEQFTVHHLIPEFKNVDFFLKIYSDFEDSSLPTLLTRINKIDQILSAYSVETANIKSKNNLIFD